MSLLLTSAVDRSLVAAGQRSQRYLMLTVVAPEGSAPRMPLNLALVVDSSGSMAGNKVTQAKEAVAFLIGQLGDQDRAAVVTYDDTVTVIAPSRPMTAAAKAEALARLRDRDTGGMTNLGGGWLAGCQQVASAQSGDGQTNRVVVLTDGLANVGITSHEELVEHARQLRLRGIITSTMGVGADFNEDLLEALARHGGGRFQYVETARHIPDCVQGELGEMLQVSARGVALEVMLPQGISGGRCLNGYPVEETSRGLRLRLGDLMAGDTRRVVLELSVTPDIGGAPLTIEAAALYVEMTTGRGVDATFPAATFQSATAEKAESRQPDEAVRHEVALLLAAQAQEEAVRRSRRGDYGGAASALANAGYTLAALPGAADPAMAARIASLEALAMDAAEGLDERHLKELHYQSYLTREDRRRYDQD